MKLSNKHRKTLARIKKHPRPANLHYKDLEALLVALGYKIAHKKGSSFTFNNATNQPWSYHRPHPGNTVDKGAVDALHKHLIDIGVL